MNIIKRCIIVFPLFIFVFLLSESPASSANNTRDEDNSLTNTLYQIKHVILNNFTSDEIATMVQRSIEKGAIGYKVVRSEFTKDMGWLIEDSKGREVFRVYFTFNNNRTVSNGRYLGPLISKEAKKGTNQQIHQFHRDILSRNYKLIGQNTYDIGDNCKGSINLFKSGATDPGRTVITVDCL